MKPGQNHGTIYVWRKKPAGALALALVAAEIPFRYEHADITATHAFKIDGEKTASLAYKFAEAVLRKEEFDTA